METVFFEQKMQRLPTDARQEVSDYLDFLLHKYRKRNTVKPYAGCMKGTFTWMSDDFNESLEDFKDYM